MLQPSMTATDLSDDDDELQEIKDIFDDAGRGGCSWLDVDDIALDCVSRYLSRQCAFPHCRR